MIQIPINLTSAGAEDKTVFDAASAAIRTNVYDYYLVASAAVTLTLKDQDSNVFGVYALTANQLFVIAGPMGGGPRFCAEGDILLGFSGVATVTGHITLAWPQS